MTVTLDQIVPWGRTYSEYQRMFALTPDDEAGRILGCGDGPASFNAEMTAKGRRVLSFDPLYDFAAGEIERRVDETYPKIVSQVTATINDYVWTDFKDPEDLGRHRLSAMRAFLTDYERGKAEGRYLTALLPTLPFADDDFTLALCSHLLFLYSEQLSLDFHIQAITEILRVAGEVRIFPLLDLKCNESPHVKPVQAHFESQGVTVEIRPVNYEFQVGGNRMMRVTVR